MNKQALEDVFNKDLFPIFKKPINIFGIMKKPKWNQKHPKKQ